MDHIFEYDHDYRFKDHLVAILSAPLVFLLWLPFLFAFLLFPRGTADTLARVREWRRSLRTKYKPLKK